MSSQPEQTPMQKSLNSLAEGKPKPASAPVGATNGVTNGTTNGENPDYSEILNTPTPSLTHRKRKMLSLTVCGYRRPGVSEELYGEYMRKKHSQLVRGLMAKYGIIRWTFLYDEQFANIADYDCFSQSVFETVDGLVNMKEDPFYKEYVKDDHNVFADTRRTQITIGQFEEFIVDGNVVAS
ncbi:MAG: hypothetical protein LQ338_005070 [Usnochroma carphineum]|nr:MAG: hypothetical protein LQ338_005070 [Usnochroma carphineum]